MATPSTVATWALNGVTTEFDVPFDYLSRTFVKVTLVGAVPTPLTLGTDYQFITPTRIQTFTAYGPPEFTLIEIRRETSTTERLVEFHDASILTASDMNTADLQVLHVAEEARNSATETIGVNNDGDLDARGRRIVNIAPPRPGTSDAVSMSYYQGDVNGAYQARVAAEAARDKSQEWATKAGTVDGSLKSSKGYAEDSAAFSQTAESHSNAAGASAAASAASASTSQNFAGIATSEAFEAEQHSTNASSSANSAYLSMENSQKWATNPEDSVVSAGKYSAFHWSQKSKAWADAAADGVLPAGSVTASKLSTDQKANMVFDADFKDATSWYTSGAITGVLLGSDATTGSYLKGTVDSSGASGSVACEVWSEWFPVRNNPAVYAQASLRGDAIGGTYGGAVEVLIEFRDAASQIIGTNTVVPQTGFTAAMGAYINGNATVAVPSAAASARVRYRVTYGTSGVAKATVFIQSPAVVPAPYKAATDSLGTRVQAVESRMRSIGDGQTRKFGTFDANVWIANTSGRTVTVGAVVATTAAGQYVSVNVRAADMSVARGCVSVATSAGFTLASSAIVLPGESFYVDAIVGYQKGASWIIN